MSSKFSTSYNNKRVTQIKESTKSPIRQVMDTISPLLTVLGIFCEFDQELKSILVTVLCCLMMANYFLQNIVHEMAGRIAIGLVVGSILGNFQNLLQERNSQEAEKECQCG